MKKIKLTKGKVEGIKGKVLVAKTKKKKSKKKKVELNPNHLEDFEALLNQAITPPASK